MCREKLAWNLSFGLLIVVMIEATGVLACMMVSRNKRVDTYIRKVCDELSNQFEKEGYAIRYKTRTQEKGAFLGHIFPERAICFRELTVEQLGERWSKEVYIPPDPHDVKVASEKNTKENSKKNTKETLDEEHTLSLENPL